jgi:hypothetical protein
MKPLKFQMNIDMLAVHRLAQATGGNLDQTINGLIGDVIAQIIEGKKVNTYKHPIIGTVFSFRHLGENEDIDLIKQPQSSIILP